MMPEDEQYSYKNPSSITTIVKYENSRVQPSSRGDLFDVLGVDVKSKLFNGR